MLESARACDADGLLVETLLGSVHGQVLRADEGARSFAAPVT
jgi:hypothetical protein